MNGKELKQLRKENNMTIDALANLINYTPIYIYQLESSNLKIAPKLIRLLEFVFKQKLNYENDEEKNELKNHEFQLSEEIEVPQDIKGGESTEDYINI